MTFARLIHAFRLIKAPLVSARRHWYLLREFVLRDIRGRFAGSMGGILWTLVNPLATIVVYVFVFSIVLRVEVTAEETGTASFAVYFLSGLFPWFLFSEALSRSVGCLIENANLITKVVFPVELLPVSTVLSAFVVNGVGMLLFVGYLLFAGYFHVTWLLLLFLIPAQMFFTWGVASILAAATVFVRDIRELFGIILMVWFFATPIIYPLSMVPDWIEQFIVLNPMSVFVESYRDILLMHQFHWVRILEIGLFSFVSYVIGAWFFMRAKPAFGDVL